MNLYRFTWVRSMTTCILCLRDDGGAESREHVLQAFLGARWTLPLGVVCDRCNSSTSVLDNDLKRYLSVVLQRDARQSVLGRSMAVVQVDGRWWATQVRDPGFERFLPPQILIPRNETDPALLWGETAAEVEALRRELGAGIEIKTQVTDGLGQALRDQCILTRSGPGKYALWSEPAFLESIVEGSVLPRISTVGLRVVEGLRKRLDEQGGLLMAVLPVNLRHVHRALNKLALNFISHALGAEIAALPLFFQTRRFVLNGVGASDCIISMDSLRSAAGAEATSDSLLVAEKVFEYSGEDASKLAAEVLQVEKHVLLLGSTSKGIFLYVSLYGQPVAAVHLLPPLPGAEIRGVLGGAVVDPACAEGDEFETLPPDRKAIVHGLFHEWASYLHPQVAPPPATDFIPSAPLPFRFQAMYARHPSLPPRES